MTTTAERPKLAALNEGFRTRGSSHDYDWVREYRVGKWGLVWSRDGHASRGVGGDKLHVSKVTVIERVHPDYNWRPYCAERIRSNSRTPEENQRLVDKQWAEHEAKSPWHYCRQPQVGDVVAVAPVCRFDNVRGTGAWTPEEVDTDRVTCLNCRRQFFGEEVDGVEERRKARAEVEQRKAAKPKPARCFWCGDIRPHTKATRAGEQLPCSNCKDQFETIYWVETTGYSNKYFAEMADSRDAQHDARMLHMGLEDETKACEWLERVEGKYFR